MEFKVLADTFEALEKTTKRNEMTQILASLFKQADKEIIDKLIYLLQGNVAPPYTGLEIGLGEKFIEEAIRRATGFDKKHIEDLYKEMGDLGFVAEELAKKKRQMTLFVRPLDVAHVYQVFYKIATVTGEGSQEAKIRWMTELLNNASPKEARYLVRIPLGRLRLGIGDPTILDALSLITVGTKEAREILERAYNLCSDLGYVAKILYEKGLEGVKNVKIVVGKPIRPALAERLPTAEDIIKKIGKCAAEAKYDGFRCQVHRKGDKVWIFSRRLENMTHMFPEIVEAAKKLEPEEYILEGEALSYNEETGEFYPFQITIQRKRKYGIAKMAEEFPLKLFAFDILYLNGTDLTQKPYKERRKILEKVVGQKNEVINVSEMKIVETADELEKIFQEYISRGLEGVVAKDLNQPYIAGARKFAWIKLKRSYKGELADTIDVVILGYFKGRGARAKFGFGGFLAGVYDEEADMFRTIAKVGSGFTEEQMVKLREILDQIKVGHKPARVDSLIEPDVWVEPKYVVTLTADEITKSPMHTCGREKDTGFALRFPRLVGWIREDKKPEDATTVKEIIEMYKEQKRVKME